MSGNCGCSTVSLPVGPAGSQGIQGPAGADGLFGGYSLEWAFDTTTTSGTSSTKVRLNNSTYNLVTTIYVNDSNIDSTDSSAFLASMGSPYGLIKLFKEDNSNVFWMGEVTAITDSGTEYALTVTYVLHNGTFANDDNVVVSFAKKGATGSSTTGTTVLEVDLTEYEEDQNTFATVTKSFAVPADTWETVDDTVELEMMFVADNTTSGSYGIRLELDSNVVSMSPTLNDLHFAPDNSFVKIRVQLMLKSSGTVTPLTEISMLTNSVYANNEATGAPSYGSVRRGGDVGSLTTSGALDLDVTLLSSVTGKNIKMFYYKLISMKK